MKTEVFKDCLRKIKIFYYLDKCIESCFWSSFEQKQVTIRDFGKYVKNAKSQFVIVERNCFHATGVVGEKLIIVTYEKSKAFLKERQKLERLLQKYENT